MADGPQNLTSGGQSATIVLEDRFFRALVQVRNVLGPDHFGCINPMCEGCQAEGAEALRIVNEALGFSSEQNQERDPASEPKEGA